jgi:hypothetical protein
MLGTQLKCSPVSTPVGSQRLYNLSLSQRSPAEMNFCARKNSSRTVCTPGIIIIIRSYAHTFGAELSLFILYLAPEKLFQRRSGISWLCYNSAQRKIAVSFNNIKS